VVQSLSATQSVNPYSYAWNDPLKYIDPSGHSLLGEIIGLVVGIVVAVALPYLAPEYFAAMSVPTLAVAGFVGGFVGAYISTGSLSASITAGLISGLTAAAFASLGSYVSNMNPGSEWTKGFSVLSHAAIGCGSAMLSGGNCGRGALAAGISEAAYQAGWIEPPSKSLASWGTAKGAAEAGLVGGIAEEVVGGRFGDGFTVSAAGYIFNAAAHPSKMQAARDSIADWAKAVIGSENWAYDGSVDGYPAGVNKCNVFVADMIQDAGATPMEFERFSWSHFSEVKYYALAGQWANATLDPTGSQYGWMIVSKPEPGDVFAYPHAYSDATGHSGIYIGNGNGVWAGQYTINTGSISQKFPGQTFTYRRWVGTPGGN